jgi:hypothetical protein
MLALKGWHIVEGVFFVDIKLGLWSEGFGECLRCQES